MKSHTHCAATSTSALCAASALIEGMRRNSASSSNQRSDTGRAYQRLGEVSDTKSVRQLSAASQVPRQGSEMGRNPRPFVPEGTYHLTAYGIDDRPIFVDVAD